MQLVPPLFAKDELSVVAYLLADTVTVVLVTLYVNVTALDAELYP